MENRIKEGDLYRRVTLYGQTFELYYGYYEEFERGHSEPIPIYPDFLAHPLYTTEGYPFATQMQDMCEKGAFRERSLQDACCGNCAYFRAGEDLFGICTCKTNQKTMNIYGGNRNEKNV
ncbi:MAG: hypothetical protein IJW29_00085 [Clostridia bacterium]|nr:hypothetical protein [Clostridia bacterium]